VSHPRSQSNRTVRQLWQRNGLIWIALMLLLVLSFFLAYIPMGLMTPASGILIAFIKASLVILLFMELIKTRSINQLAALSGVVFLTIFFCLTLADVLTR
jgi:cytochrome c oxidase subunit 4